jgi:hypothetical protein
MKSGEALYFVHGQRSLTVERKARRGNLIQEKLREETSSSQHPYLRATPRAGLFLDNNLDIPVECIQETEQPVSRKA